MAARRRRGGFILIVLALIIILGIVAVYFLLQRGALGILPGPEEESQTPQAPAVETVDIVITTQNIPRGVELTQDVLATIPYPKQDLVEGIFFTNMEDVVGKRAVTLIQARLPLTTTMVVDGENSMAAYPSFDIQANFTAVSMPISQLTSVSYNVQRGDHVMVIGCMLLVDLDTEFQSALPNLSVQVYNPGLVDTLTTGTIGLGQAGQGVEGRTELDDTLGQPIYVLPSEPQRPRLVCQTVIYDATVLGVGDYAAPVEIVTDPNVVPLDQAAETETAEEAPVVDAEPPDVISLVVSPQDAVSLNYMLLSGVKLSLALRNPTDTTAFLTEPVTQQYLLDQKGIPLPAKLPYAIEPRVDVLAFPGEELPSTGVPQE